MEQEISQPGSSITIRVVFLSILLSGVLAIANTFLALKVGILTSASIPAAVLSMALLSKCKDVSIYEYNLIQTAASAGEAVAGGIVYIIPAVVIINFWHRFDYLTNAMIALIGGLLGLLLSIPLRKILVSNPHLAFPEGKAIAEVLKMKKHEGRSIRPMIEGLGIAAVIELLQSFLKVIPESMYRVVSIKKHLFVLGAGFSPALVGAGYLMGETLSFSLFVGSLLSGVVLMPVTQYINPGYCANCEPSQLAELIWNDSIRFIAIATMLTASLIALLRLLPSLWASIKQSWQQEMQSSQFRDQDIPLPYILLLINLMVIGLFCLFIMDLPLGLMSFTRGGEDTLIWGGIVLVLVLGVVFCTITAYFSGLLGVTATPGSGLFISLILIVSLFVKFCVTQFADLHLAPEQIRAAEAASLIIASVVGGAAAVSIDNVQDLKVGYIIGAIPWRQQVMLALGVVVSALIIPLVMQLLLGSYGLGHTGYMTGVDVAKVLPAPPASLLATMTKAVFEETIQPTYFLIGGVLSILLLVLQRFLSLWKISISALGLAIGMYLPYSTTMPIMLGGAFAAYAKYNLAIDKDNVTMFACGLLAGASILEIFISFLYIFLTRLEYNQMLSPGIQFIVSIGVYTLLFSYLCKSKRFALVKS